HVPVAGDVVLETLELHAAVGRDVRDGERGKVGQAAVGTDGAELPGLGDDLLIRPGVLEGLQHGDIDRLGPYKRDGPAFCDGHVLFRGSVDLKIAVTPSAARGPKLNYSHDPLVAIAPRGDNPRSRSCSSRLRFFSPHHPRL